MPSISSGTTPGGGASRPVATSVCCLSPNRTLIEELTPALMRCLPGAAMCAIRSYPQRDALQAELAGSLPDLCFLDLVSDRRRALDLIPDFIEVSPATRIIVLLSGNEPELILKSLRLGASEFLLQPFTAEQMEASLSKLLNREPGANAAGSGRVYCVMPAKGACGASIVASNLAILWQQRMGASRVLLADMDPMTGTLAFLLKVKSTYTFLDVLNRAASLDADLWNAMVTRVKGLDVLLAPEQLLEWTGEIRDAAPIVDYARRNYDMVVLDAAGAYGEWNLSLARASDEVLLVTTNELPSLQGAQRALAYLDASDIARAKLRVVLNRYDADIGLGSEVVASALHVDVIQVIPSDYDTVQQALIDCKPVAPGSGIGKSLARLAATLAGPRNPEAAKTAAAGGGLRSLLARLS